MPSPDTPLFKKNLLESVKSIIRVLNTTTDLAVLQNMFRDANLEQVPPHADKNAYYFAFLTRLEKVCPCRDDVILFSTHLNNYIRGQRHARLTHTLLIIFWIKLQCFLEDKLEKTPTRNVIAEFTEILEDTFSGNSCLAKCTSEHTTCNHGCIKYVNDYHKLYYSKIYKNSRCCRQNCNPLTNCIDGCCSCFCNPICFLGGLLVAIAVIVGGTIAIINVF